MDLSEYEAFVVGPRGLLGSSPNQAEMALGLAEEAGEVAGKLKRWARGDYRRDAMAALAPPPMASTDPGETFAWHARVDDHARASFEAHVRAELGDVLFYLVALARLMGVSIQEVAMKNQEKLENRRARGVLKGTGDQR